MGQDKEVPSDGLVHDEVEIEDFEYDPETDTFTYPCPCGDEFSVLKDELLNGEKYARCPSCSLMVLVVYDLENLNSILETKSARKESKSSTKPTSIRASS